MTKPQCGIILCSHGRLRSELLTGRCILPQNLLVPLQCGSGERGDLVVKALDSGSRGRRFEPHSGQTVSLSKAHLLPKSTGNTQEAMAPSQHD